MTNAELIKQHFPNEPVAHFNHFQNAVLGLMDAARKDEALKSIQFVLNNGTGDWYRMDAEELYKLFNPQTTQQ